MWVGRLKERKADDVIIIIQRLSHEVGWSYRDVVDRLEEKRKVKASAFFERKQAALKIKTQALKSSAASTPLSEKLAVYGF